VSKQLDRVLNPKAQKFLDVASAFEGDWAKDLQSFFDEDEGRRKNAIDSIMNNRHLIAHGRNAGISVARVREYLKAIEEVLDYIEQQIA
jgi:RiboL-PSP-HEPN